MVFDLVCFSHLRWDFVYQRPQHLLSRCARDRRVFFIEEPIYGEETAWLDLTQPGPNIWVVQPHLVEGLVPEQQEEIQRALLDHLLRTQHIEEYVLWYYTPMATGFSRHLAPLATVYDCMDELSLFAGASPLLRERERELLARADLVFTGGQSLYEAKRDRHRNVYAFPSSVDAGHFSRSRDAMMQDPTDQRAIARPRLGFYGVIDERMDLDLVAGVAEQRPDWQLVLVGPIVKVDPQQLPQRGNIHYLGAKSYEALPAYLAGWDVAMMPFALNDATRFISPTKTLEYLAGGKPVVSTPITDVAAPYGRQGLVRIAATVAEFVEAAQAALAEDTAARLPAIDAFLGTTSWHRTWKRMEALIAAVVETRKQHMISLPRTAARVVTATYGVRQDGGRAPLFSTAVPRAHSLVAPEGVE